MKGFLKAAGLVVGISAAALGVYLVAIQLMGNFAAIVPGEAYRANQPTADDIASYSARYGIRTIVNLRGRHDGADWYKDEAAAAKRLGIRLVDFPMEADRRLDAEGAGQLVALLRDAPRPILIHCRSGADRTGLASVLYLARISGIEEEKAERQLSLRFGHFAIPFLSSAYAMDESWETLETTGT